MMLSREVERMNRQLLLRATLIEAGKAGPLVLDYAGIIEIATILGGWVDMADAMEQATVPERFKTAEVIQLRRPAR
jgi:hypothetical protein